MNEDDDAYRELFLQRGWKLFQEDMRSALDALEGAALNCQSYPSLCELRGQVNQLRRVVQFEDLYKLQAEIEDDALEF